ncbi:hypothetical protein Q7P35_005492 [Cladosporium inversicolor]
MAATIPQLVMAQKQTAESQKAFLESNKAISDCNKALLESNKELTETIKTQGKEIKALKALLEETPRPRSYSEAIANSGTSVDLQSSQTRSTSAASSQLHKENPQVQDDRAVSIDMARFEGSKNNYNVIRDGLRARLKVNNVTEKLTIKSLQPSPGNRIDVLFADKDEANKANKTLNKGFAKDFKADNSCKTADCTAMKATWLDKVDAKKRTGTAMFGATDAFCSLFVVRDDSSLCYYYNRVIVETNARTKTD